MSEHRYRTELWIPRSREEVFDFFSRASNLERITPPLLHFRVLTPEPIEMRAEALIDYALRIRGVPARWRTEIEVWEPPFRFVDRQLRGPYKLWHHTHTFTEQAGGTRMVDEVRYEVPFGLLGDLVNWLLVRRDVETIFEFRAATIRSIFGGAELLAQETGASGRDYTFIKTGE